MTRRLDVRDLPPAERHPEIQEAFEAIESGEAVELVNDHDPKPLFYELQAERERFDADAYRLEERGEDEFVALLPKR